MGYIGNVLVPSTFRGWVSSSEIGGSDAESPTLVDEADSMVVE